MALAQKTPVAPSPRYLLTNALNEATLSSYLMPRDGWHPFPNYLEREDWTSLPKEATVFQISKGESALSYEWPAMPASLYLDFSQVANRNRYQDIHLERRGKLLDLVLAELMEGQGRFLSQIINGIWSVCEESFWGVPDPAASVGGRSALPDVNNPNIDVFAAETAALLAWTDYLLGMKLDEVSPALRERIFQEVDRRLLRPGLERNDFWWMGFDFNNQRDLRQASYWNPWISSHWLVATLLLEQDPQRRAASVFKITRILDNFLNIAPADGGIAQGADAWDHAAGTLFECLEILHGVTAGRINVFEDPLVRNMGRSIANLYIAGDHFVSFDESPARIQAPADLIYRYGVRIRDESLAKFGAFLAKEQMEMPRQPAMGRVLHTLFNYQELMQMDGAAPFSRDTWMPDTQWMTSRSQEGSAKGIFIAVKGGANSQALSHQDVGNFIVYVNGQPALIDIGAAMPFSGTYLHTGEKEWNQRSVYHNVPQINGKGQSNEGEARAISYRNTNSFVQIGMEMAGAYPAETGLQSWNRTIRFTRGPRQNIAMADKFRFSQKPTEMVQYMMTPCQVFLTEAGEIRLRSKSNKPSEQFNFYINYDSQKFKVTTEEITLNEPHQSFIRGIWGEKITRIVFTDRNPALSDTWKFLFTTM
jgi:hypothetical protein